MKLILECILKLAKGLLYNALQHFLNTSLHLFHEILYYMVVHIRSRISLM